MNIKSKVALFLKYVLLTVFYFVVHLGFLTIIGAAVPTNLPEPPPGQEGTTFMAMVLGVALPMNIGHVLPNVFMPDPSVRLSHFVETTTSNFIFGLTVTWLMVRRHDSIRDLFGQCPKVRLQTTQLHDVAP